MVWTRVTWAAALGEGATDLVGFLRETLACKYSRIWSIEYISVTLLIRAPKPLSVTPWLIRVLAGFDVAA
jgi:hypothetical protein